MISKTFYVAAMSVRAGRTCPSDVCRRLPSDPVSRRTPLPLAVSLPQSGRFGDLRPLVCVRAGRTKKRMTYSGHPFYSLMWERYFIVTEMT